MTYMPLRTVTIDLGNLRGQIFSRTEFAPSGGIAHTHFSRISHSHFLSLSLTLSLPRTRKHDGESHEQAEPPAAHICSGAALQVAPNAAAQCKFSHMGGKRTRIAREPARIKNN